MAYGRHDTCDSCLAAICDQPRRARQKQNIRLAICSALRAPLRNILKCHLSGDIPRQTHRSASALWPFHSECHRCNTSPAFSDVWLQVVWPALPPNLGNHENWWCSDRPRHQTCQSRFHMCCVYRSASHPGRLSARSSQLAQHRCRWLWQAEYRDSPW